MSGLRASSGPSTQHDDPGSAVADGSLGVPDAADAHQSAPVAVSESELLPGDQAAPVAPHGCGSALAAPATPPATTAPPAATPGPATAIPPRRRRPLGTLAIAAMAAVIGAGAGATVGALVALHFGRHSTTTVVRETVPAPDRITSINDIPSILARVEPAVVSISSDQNSGTGLIITPSGEVVTNYHVIAGANYIHVLLFHRAGYQNASVIGYDQTDDVALLQIQGVSNLPTAVFGHSDQVQAGANVVAVGNALDLPGGLTATAGIVSAVGRSIDSSALPAGTTAPPDLIESDAAINPGNSGGPLVDADGEVIGINTLLINNLAFAIPIDTVKALLPALSAGSRAAAISLGVGLQDDSGQLASEYGLGVTRGALVSEVAPQSPADLAGVQVYDVIVGFDGQRVSDSAQLIGLLTGRRPGAVVPMSVVRGKRTLHLLVAVAGPSSTAP